MGIVISTIYGTLNYSKNNKELSSQSVMKMINLSSLSLIFMIVEMLNFRRSYEFSKLNYNSLHYVCTLRKE